jgi:hypothetical protein
LRSTLTRMLVVTTLLVIVPFSGIRVICFEMPADASQPAAEGHDLTECEQLCALHHGETPAADSRLSAKAQSPGPRANEGCALSTGGIVLDCVSFSAIAVVRAEEPPQAPVLARNLYVESSRLHLEPALTPAGPPPKHDAR